MDETYLNVVLLKSDPVGTFIDLILRYIQRGYNISVKILKNLWRIWISTILWGQLTHVKPWKYHISYKKNLFPTKNRLLCYNCNKLDHFSMKNIPDRGKWQKQSIKTRKTPNRSEKTLFQICQQHDQCGVDDNMSSDNFDAFGSIKDMKDESKELHETIMTNLYYVEI